MENEIKKYIKKEIAKLKYKDDEVNLNNVYPAILEDVLGQFLEPYDLNGYDCDYWANTYNYEIFGTMRYGTANITLKVGVEKPLDEKNKKLLEKENKKDTEIKIEDMSEDELATMNNYYFTFGGGQAHEGHYQPIKAKSLSVARKKMIEYYGLAWAFEYDEKAWIEAGKYYSGKGLHLIIAY